MVAPNRTITNNPSATPSSRPPLPAAITNAEDVGRTYPVSALDDSVVTEDELDADHGAQLRQAEDQIQFLDPDSVSYPFADLPGDVGVAVTGILDISLVTRVDRVQVDIDASSTATGIQLIVDGVAAPVGASVTLPLVRGRGTVQYTVATGVGKTVVLKLTEIAGSGLLTSDVKTITLT